MKFELEIDLSKNRIGSSAEVADALSKVADRLRQNVYPMDRVMIRGIMDNHGHTVGLWKVTDGPK